MKVMLGTALTLLSMLGAVSMVGAENITSLRGSNPLDQISRVPVTMKVQRDREPIARDFVQQPPLIPHEIKGYKINLNANKCLTCHSWANYRQAGATKISQTHFVDRENNALANIAPRRYFCTQCHVPQVETKPLVGNSFKPLKNIRRW